MTPKKSRYFISGSIVKEKVLKNQLQVEEEEFLKNLYDTTTATITQFTFDLYTENIQLICPQGIIDLNCPFLLEI